MNPDTTPLIIASIILKTQNIIKKIAILVLVVGILVATGVQVIAGIREAQIGVATGNQIFAIKSTKV